MSEKCSAITICVGNLWFPIPSVSPAKQNQFGFKQAFRIPYWSASSLQWNNKRNLANKYYPELVIIP